ncbi:MAG: hypothetical protein ACOCQH_02405 [Halanaerobiales bacterium]
MKKIAILVLSLALVMGISAVSFASSTDVTADVGVNVTVAPYYDVWFVPDAEGYKGLFGNDEVPIDQPGIYISDGQATVNSVLGIWEDAIDSAEANGIETGEVYQEYFVEGQLDDPQVELFRVDANTMVDVTLSSDFEGWMNAPTLFRVSSDEDEINGIGDWATDLAVIGNTVQTVANEDYNGLLNAHNAALEELNDTFTLDFAEELLCHGPLEFHLNGALWLPKASQVAADEYDTTVTVTVAAAQ